MKKPAHDKHTHRMISISPVVDAWLSDRVEGASRWIENAVRAAAGLPVHKKGNDDAKKTEK